MKTIELAALHTILDEAYAVCVNDTLYFVGCDGDYPYIADNNGDYYISFEEVDGDIQVVEDGYFMFIGGEAVKVEILSIQSPNKPQFTEIDDDSVFGIIHRC